MLEKIREKSRKMNKEADERNIKIMAETSKIE